MTVFCVHLVIDQPQTQAIRQGRRHGPSIAYKNTPCRVIFLQPARRVAVPGQPSSFRLHWTRLCIWGLQVRVLSVFFFGAIVRFFFSWLLTWFGFHIWYFRPTLQRHNTENREKIWNCAASIPISTFMCLWAIYIVPRSVCLYSAAGKYVDRSWEYIKHCTATDTWMWKLRLRPPRNSFSRNT